MEHSREHSHGVVDPQHLMTDGEAGVSAGELHFTLRLRHTVIISTDAMAKSSHPDKSSRPWCLPLCSAPVPINSHHTEPRAPHLQRHYPLFCCMRVGRDAYAGCHGLEPYLPRAGHLHCLPCMSCHAAETNRSIEQEAAYIHVDMHADLLRPHNPSCQYSGSAFVNDKLQPCTHLQVFGAVVHTTQERLLNNPGQVRECPDVCRIPHLGMIRIWHSKTCFGFR